MAILIPKLNWKVDMLTKNKQTSKHAYQNLNSKDYK